MDGNTGCRVKVPFSVEMITKEGWSPYELMNLAPAFDTLSCDGSGFTIVERSLKIRRSLILASFETLKLFWTPEQLAPSHAPVPITAAVVGGASSIGPRPQSFLEAEGDVIACDESVFHIVVHASGRKFVVERFQSQVTLVARCIQHSFPYVLSPNFEASCAVSVSGVEALVACIVRHLETFQSYLPVLFFLFEMNGPQGRSFFSNLTDSINQREETEQQLVPVEKVSSSMWGWFQTAKFVDHRSMTYEEEIGFLKSNPDLLGDEFIVCYARIVQLHALALTLESVTSILVPCLERELTSFDAMISSLSNLQLLSTPEFLHDEEDGRDTFPHKEFSIFYEIVGLHFAQVTKPLTSMLSFCSSNVALQSASSRIYLKRIVDLAFFVKSNEKLTGSTSRGGSQSLKEYYGQKRLSLRRCKQQFMFEHTSNLSNYHSSLLNFCVHVVSAIHHLGDPYDVHHHQQCSSSSQHHLTNLLHQYFQINSPDIAIESIMEP